MSSGQCQFSFECAEAIAVDNLNDYVESRVPRKGILVCEQCEGFGRHECRNQPVSRPLDPLMGFGKMVPPILSQKMWRHNEDEATLSKQQ